MIAHFTATFVDGVIVPDAPLPIQNQSRLELDLKSSSAPIGVAEEEDDFIAYIRANPIKGGGLRLSRDELHERR